MIFVAKALLVIIAESLALKISHNAPVLSIDLRYPLCLRDLCQLRIRAHFQSTGCRL